ncbi:MAG: hypothetical protein Kow0069_32530 [Promethearchaeota archaeon]
MTENLPPGIRGELNRWFLEVKAGVFVGKVTARVRERLWTKICRSATRGGCVLVKAAQNEQGFDFALFGDTSRQVVDFDGLRLVRFPRPSVDSDSGEEVGAGAGRDAGRDAGVEAKVEVELEVDTEVGAKAGAEVEVEADHAPGTGVGTRPSPGAAPDAHGVPDAPDFHDASDASDASDAPKSADQPGPSHLPSLPAPPTFPPDDDRTPSDVTDVEWLHVSAPAGAALPPTEYCGKWLVFGPADFVDQFWERVKQATREGRLGPAAKVSTARPSPRATSDARVVAVYTRDARDLADVSRVREELRKMGVTRKIPYKLEADSQAGRYSEPERGGGRATRGTRGTGRGRRISLYYE